MIDDYEKFKQAGFAVCSHRTGDLTMPQQQSIAPVNNIKYKPVKEKSIKPIQEKDLINIPENSALLRTLIGDIIYPIYGVDLTNDDFIVLYLTKEGTYFFPLKDNNYIIALKIRGEGTLIRNVYYAGITFDINNLKVVVFQYA